MVRRVLANSLLSLVLLATVMWGGCISCDEFFMWAGTKSCCSPDGHCKTKTPSSPQKPNRECKQIAFDHQKVFDYHMDLPVITTVKVDLDLPSTEAPGRWQDAIPVEPSPPDLQILHSTFLI